MTDQVEVPAELIIQHYQKRVVELEMQVALLAARCSLAEGGLIEGVLETGEASEAGLPKSPEGEQPAPDGTSQMSNDDDTPSS